MSSKRALVLGWIVASVALVRLPALAAAPAAPALTEAGLKLEAGYAQQLKALRAEIGSALPQLDAQQSTALHKARAEIKRAQAAANAAKQALDAVAGAKGLVDHAKGKWIGGAVKGIAAAEAAIKKAKSDGEREAAQKELAKWQANKEEGLKALKERQAALDKARANEPALQQANAAANAALAAAKANELAISKALLLKAAPFISSDKLDARLVRCAVLANATPRGLAEFAQQGTAQREQVERLLADPKLMKAMLEAGGAREGKYGQAMRVYLAIRTASPRSGEGVFHRLALATSLEHAAPIAQDNPPAEAQAPAVVDPVKRYQHFERAHLSGELDPAFKDLSAWELRNVVNGDESDATLAWGREMLRNYRPDHVLNPDYGWRYSGMVRTDVKYGSQNVKDDLPTLQSYQNICRNGGVCGRRAFFGRFILRSFGIPTVARPQRGHGALAHWTPKGWVINLGAGWGYHEAKGVMGMTDEDFVLETQVRQHPGEHMESLRAQWAGDALGEQKYISLKPDTGGLWNLLALHRKREIVAAAKPATLAALGEELGEAEESTEARARALVKATVTEMDKKLVVDSRGVITIPAAACGGAQIVGSFLGGHQLFSGGGAITCNVEVPAEGRYTLTARVVTVHLNPSLQLAVNNAKSTIDIPLPYTLGQWQRTSPIQLTLSKGKNSLRFTRPAGSRGLTLKEFTLTPVK